MSGYGPSRRELIRCGETMNRLKDEQHALNMRLLLAMQNHDEAAQAQLESQLARVLEEIRCLGARTESARP